MRDNLIRLAIQYDGDYYAIRRAINNNEIANKDIRIQRAITIYDSIYPTSLKQLKQPPFVLFYYGNINLLNTNMIAVVGSRLASETAISKTIETVDILKDKFTIVSGLAKGIDSIAHKHAINTIAVIGNGLNIHYPSENDELYKYMKQHQLVLSEYPLDVGPHKYHFPFRNRIIAALASDIFVMQANSDSGSLITARYGLQLDKHIYTLQYKYNGYDGKGCNDLIENGATIINYANLAYLLSNIDKNIDKN